MKTDQNRHHKGVIGAALAQLGGFFRAAVVATKKPETVVVQPTELADVVAAYLELKGIKVFNPEDVDTVLDETYQIEAGGLRCSSRGNSLPKFEWLGNVHLAEHVKTNAESLAFSAFKELEHTVRHLKPAAGKSPSLRLHILDARFGLLNGKAVLVGPMDLTAMTLVREPAKAVSFSKLVGDTNKVAEMWVEQLRAAQYRAALAA